MFNKETEYALKALVYIQAQNNRSMKPGIAEIAKAIEAPPFYIAKILQRIVRHGLMQSTKGKNGGFYFDPEKPELPLKDVIRFTEGTALLTGCGLGLKLCSDNNPCPLHEKFASIRDSINKLVNEETIQSLAVKTTNGQTSLVSSPKTIL